MGQHKSVIINFLTAILLLTITALTFLIGDRLFFDGRLSGRHYHHSKAHRALKAATIKNIQLQEELKIITREIQDVRRQNEDLIKSPPLPEGLTQYLENGGNQALAFFKALYPVVQDIGNIAQIKLMNGKFYVGTPLLFGNGSSKLSHEAKKTLDQVATTIHLMKDRLPADAKWTVRVEGYADHKAVKHKTHLKNNWTISTARALAVVEYLTHKGIDGSMFVATGHGKYQSENQSQLLGLPHQRFVTLIVDAG